MGEPEKHLFAYRIPRRLSAEELRDSLLKATGELNPAIGGLPVMPEINMEIALQPRMIQFSIAPAYQPSRTPAERNRRTIYAYRVRGQADPFLEVFNKVDVASHVVQALIVRPLLELFYLARSRPTPGCVVANFLFFLNFHLYNCIWFRCYKI